MGSEPWAVGSERWAVGSILKHQQGARYSRLDSVQKKDCPLTTAHCSLLMVGHLLGTRKAFA